MPSRGGEEILGAVPTRSDEVPRRVVGRGGSGGDAAPFVQVDEMGEDIARGRLQEAPRNVAVDRACDVIGPGRTLREGCEDFGLALGAVGDEPVETCGGVGHRGPVTGQVEPVGPRPQPRAGGEKIGHVAVGRGNERRRPAHDVVAREQDVAEGEGEMAAEMAGAVDDLETALAVLDARAVPERAVRPELRIDALAAAAPARGREARHDRAPPGRGRAEGEHGRARRGGEGPRAGGVVAVRMGDEHRMNPRIGHRGEERGAMGGAIGSGVDDRDVPSTQHIAVGAPIRHRPGVRRENAANSRSDIHGHAGGRLFRFQCHGRHNTLWPMKVHWLSRYLPRSLYGRAAVILLVPVVTVQLVFSIGFIQRHYEGVTRQMTGNVLLEISTLVERVEAAGDPFAAAEAAAEYGAPVAIDTTLPAASPVEDARAFYDLSGRVVTGALRAGLPGLVAVDLSTDERAVALLIDTVNGPLGLSFSRERVSASNPHQLLILMVATSVLMTVIAYFFLWNQLLPVRRMAEAAEAFGRGRTVPFRPGGATELRRAGAAFLEMRGRIERHIDQRTRMLSGVSHDIRTPLTRMRLGLSLLPESEERAALEQDVKDMEGMLEAFLNFARGEGAGPTEPTDPEALLARVVEKARRGGHAVETGEMPADPVGLVDLRPLAIERALENLVGNAVRYGTRAMVSLAATQRVLRFTVEDNGPGIAREAREDALRPFVRLDAARNQDAGSGVGLGLSIAADIARQHGGTLRLGESARLGGLAVDLVIAR